MLCQINPTEVIGDRFSALLLAVSFCFSFPTDKQRVLSLHKSISNRISASVQFYCVYIHCEINRIKFERGVSLKRFAI